MRPKAAQPRHGSRAGALPFSCGARRHPPGSRKRKEKKRKQPVAHPQISAHAQRPRGESHKQSRECRQSKRLSTRGRGYFGATLPHPRSGILHRGARPHPPAPAVKSRTQNPTAHRGHAQPIPIATGSVSPLSTDATAPTSTSTKTPHKTPNNPKNTEPHKRTKREPTFRGTINAIGSTVPPPPGPPVVTLYARAISHSPTFSARRGRKHIPRCGSEDLCSESGCSASASYSK
jgi:hypothetical protein